MSLVAISYIFNGGVRKLVDRLVTERHPEHGFITTHDVFSMETCLFSSERKPLKSFKTYLEAKSFHESLVKDSRQHRDGIVDNIVNPKRGKTNGKRKRKN